MPRLMRRRMLSSLFLPLIVLNLCLAYELKAQTFSSPVKSAVPSRPGLYGLGDFKGNGKSELIVFTPETNSVAVMPMIGDGSFGTPVITNGIPDVMRFGLGDFNGDKKVDLVTVRASADQFSNVYVSMGNGDGTFQAQVPVPVSFVPQNVYIADLNGDGRSDLIVVGDGSTASIFLSQSGGTFQRPIDLPITPFTTSLAIGDFNHDGKMDLAIAESDDGIAIMLGNGDGTFRSSLLPMGSIQDSTVHVGDFNNDGNLDVLLSQGTSNNVWFGKGDGTFGPPVVSFAPGFRERDDGSTTVVGDFNLDGILDLALIVDDGMYVLPGNGRGEFSSLIYYQFNDDGVPIEIVAADVNGDGKTDVILVDTWLNKIEVLLNQTGPSSISGILTDGAGEAIIGSSVYLIGTTTPVKAETDNNGKYSFVNLPTGANFTVTPGDGPLVSTHIFDPPSRQFFDIRGNQTADFKGVELGSIRGCIVDSNGVGLSGVTVTANDGVSTFTATTDRGCFTVNGSQGAARNRTYVITPSFGTVNFNPSNRVIVLNNFSAEADFTVQGDYSVRYVAADVSVRKGDGSATVLVNRIGKALPSADLIYVTEDLTADQRTDYTAGSGVLSFAAGEVSKSLSIPITNNTFVTGDRTFDVNYFTPVGSIPSTAELGHLARVTIHDNATAASNKNPVDDPEEFVRQLYADFLHRLPDAPGLAYWTQEITRCGSDAKCIHDRRVTTADAFFFEPEFQERAGYILRLSKATGGFPGYDFFKFLNGMLAAGPDFDRSKTDVAIEIVRDSDFDSNDLFDGANGLDFVDQALELVEASSGLDLTRHRDDYIRAFNQARGWDESRGLVFRAIADTPEFIDSQYNESFVRMEYYGYLRRDVDQAGFDFWKAKVDARPLRDIGIQHAMVCSFITSAEYQHRFSPLVTRSNQDCQPSP